MVTPLNNNAKFIWFYCTNWNDIHRSNLLHGLHELGKKYNLILVQWYTRIIYDLTNFPEVKKFLKGE